MAEGDYLRLAPSFCCRVMLSVMPGMGWVQLSYKPGEALCGRCILCVLLTQIPANEPPPKEDDV